MGKSWYQQGKSWYQQDVSVVLVVVMCVFIVCQTPTFVDHILTASSTTSSLPLRPHPGCLVDHILAASSTTS